MVVAVVLWWGRVQRMRRVEEGVDWKEARERVKKSRRDLGGMVDGGEDGDADGWEGEMGEVE